MFIVKRLIFCALFAIGQSFLSPEAKAQTYENQISNTKQTTSKDPGYSTLFQFVVNNLWNETKKRLNIQEFNVSKDTDAGDQSNVSINVKTPKIKFSAKIPKNK